MLLCRAVLCRAMPVHLFQLSTKVSFMMRFPLVIRPPCIGYLPHTLENPSPVVVVVAIGIALSTLCGEGGGGIEEGGEGGGSRIRRVLMRLDEHLYRYGSS